MRKYNVYYLIVLVYFINPILEWRSSAFMHSNSALVGFKSALSSVSTRQFIPFPRSNQFDDPKVFPPEPNPLTQQAVLRVMQFNVLADGLAGKRQNLGGFSRAKLDILNWEYRKHKLLYEITQYNPDIITMQEVDHYYDFFWPKLSNLGYVGYFAPKPTSACLEVSPNADGCAIFVHKEKLRVITSETKTLALSKAEFTTGELNEDDKAIRAQNQVALIVVCQLLGSDGYPLRKSAFLGTESEEEGEAIDDFAPPIVIGTTHLKSSKTLVGEQFRRRGILQILQSIEKVCKGFSDMNRPPAVILTGDFNAVAERTSYDPLAYRAIKGSKLGLRSVYNEDVPYSTVRLSSKDIYTTWKARNRSGQEEVVKRCIDYIFYVPFKLNNLDSQSSIKPTETIGIEVIPVKKEKKLAISSLLRVTVYFFLTVVPLTAAFSDLLLWFEKIIILCVGFTGLAIFESAAEGTVFKPVVDYRLTANMGQLATFIEDRAVVTPSVFNDSTDDSMELLVQNISMALQNATIPLSSMYRIAQLSEQQVLRNVASVSQQLQPTKQLGRPGFRLQSVLDLFAEEELEPDLIPSSNYPSDHLAIGADLQLLW